MFEIGEVVSYGTTGICTIEDIRMESMSRAGTKKQEFYVLRPVATPTCVTMVPASNEKLVGKMRRILSREAINAMIDSVQNQQMAWIDDPRQRTEVFNTILSEGISGELLKLIALLYEEKQARGKTGHKFCFSDDKILTSADRMVRAEFAYALQIPQSKVASYIASRIAPEEV